MDANTSFEYVKNIFDQQKLAYSPSTPPSYKTRLDRLNRIIELCKNHIDDICEALDRDFGSRHADWSFIADIYSPLSHAKYIKRNLKKWMKKEKTSSGILSITGQKTYIVNEPLGVVGIMSPFNAPVSLALDPCIEAIAAGNSVMIKISESTPSTALVIQSLIERYFNIEEISVICGNSDISKYFVSLPWDKFMFTGGSETGKKVLKGVSDNLSPVILELGGKSPCIILEDADISSVAKKIAKVRQLNAGQVCISGDYVLLPEHHLKSFIHFAIEESESTYPNIIDNEYFTSIINLTEYDRIISYIDEAINCGNRIIQANLNKENVPDRTTRKIPLTIIVNPSDDLMVSQNEIFGPVLPVYTYNNLDHAIETVNSREKPLALYIFGHKRIQIDKIINSTTSGGVTVNDLIMHAGSNTMGFGGVGYSGTGRYKGGFIGYQAFSNPKSVLEQGLLRKLTGRFMPPFKSERTRNILRRQAGIR